ncbi:cytochrome P450 [Astrocystis sublimbata]|nr:cytochrome P450 [Astrocystis sublimbata]
MVLPINWSVLLVLVSIYYATLVFYRLFLHPLARFPGPKLAAISRWYEAYHDVVRGGQYTSKIAELHASYGPIIRISPHELHVADAAFFDALYRTDGHWDMYSWAYDAFGAKGSTVFGSNHDAHRAHRRAIAPLFSKTAVVSRLDIVSRNVDKLSKRLSLIPRDTTLDLGAAISAFTRDIANEFIIGKAYNELDLEDFGVGLSIASSGAGPFWRITKHVRWFGPAMKALPVPWAMKVADEGMKSFFRYLQQTEQDTRDLMAAAQASSPDDDDKANRTLVHEIIHSSLPAADKSFERILEEVATVTGAGYETTANTLRLILYHVYANNAILRNLRRELPTELGSPPPLSELEKLPYLTAVLMEGLRLSPGISSRAARVTDKDLMYKDWRIPAGTPVGMTAILLHTDGKLYPDPMRFDPTRWLDRDTGSGYKVRDGGRVPFAPFSRGTRICLGMHLAWAELYLLLSHLVTRFDFSYEGVQDADFELERDNFGIGTKAGCHLVARVELYRG